MSALARELPLLFKSLSDPTRLRLLNLLCEGEVCVCHLVFVLGMVQPVKFRGTSPISSAWAW